MLVANQTTYYYGMETEKTAEERFSYEVIHQYLRDGSYPDSYTKTDKQALRKRIKVLIILMLVVLEVTIYIYSYFWVSSAIYIYI